jgi:hypothetical protein
VKKLVSVADVRVGDGICLKGFACQRVLEISEDPVKHILLKLDNGLTAPEVHEFLQKDEVVLVHRLWAEEKTRRDMLSDIVSRAFTVHALRGYVLGMAGSCTPPDLEAAIVALHKAIEDYELGKPLE